MYIPAAVWSFKNQETRDKGHKQNEFCQITTFVSNFKDRLLRFNTPAIVSNLRYIAFKLTLCTLHIDISDSSDHAAILYRLSKLDHSLFSNVGRRQHLTFSGTFLHMHCWLPVISTSKRFDSVIYIGLYTIRTDTS